MFIILYYDVNEKRCAKMLKKCREYLVWVQKSVFEGELTEGQLARLTNDLSKIVCGDDGDSLVIYRFESKKYSERITIGADKKDKINFL